MDYRNICREERRGVLVRAKGRRQDNRDIQ